MHMTIQAVSDLLNIRTPSLALSGPLSVSETIPFQICTRTIYLLGYRPHPDLLLISKSPLYPPYFYPPYLEFLLLFYLGILISFGNSFLIISY